DGFLGGRRHRGTAQLEVEEPVIDRADVHGRAETRLLRDPATEPGHASHAPLISRDMVRPVTPVRITAAILLAAAAACGGSETAGPAPIRFLHTFSADETELVNQAMAERGLSVDGSLVPFA